MGNTQTSNVNVSQDTNLMNLYDDLKNINITNKTEQRCPICTLKECKHNVEQKLLYLKNNIKEKKLRAIESTQTTRLFNQKNINIIENYNKQNYVIQNKVKI